MPSTRDTTSVRITTEAHATLQRLAEADGLSLTDELDRVIERARRERLFDQADEAYKKLRADEEACTEVEAERETLEGTLMDGLEAADE